MIAHGGGLGTHWCQSHVETAFSSMIEGKNEEMSTSELSGGARIHYIFQSIFVKSLEVCIIYHLNLNADIIICNYDGCRIVIFLLHYLFFVIKI